MDPYTRDTATVTELAMLVTPEMYTRKSPSTMMKFLNDCHGPAIARLHQIWGTGSPKQREVGKFTHEILEIAVIDAIDSSGTIMRKETLAEIVECEMNAKSFGEGLDDIDTDEQIAEVRQEARDFSNGIYTLLADLNNPIAAEQKVYYTHEGPKHAHDMVAIIDIVDEDPNPGPDGRTRLRIRDLKTSATFSPDRYLKSPQMGVYTAAMTANGYPTDLARIDHFRRLKSGIKYSQIEMQRGPEHWKHIGRLLDQMQDQILEKKFIFNPTSWMCNGGCPLWDRCDFRFPDEPALSA